MARPDARRRHALQALLAWPALGLAGCATVGPGGAMRSTVRGTITWRERIALPPDAEIIVRLQDVSRMDAPATVLAEQRIRADGHQPPFTFALEVDASRLDARMRCTVSARVEQAGRLLFINDTAYPVLTQGAPMQADLLLVAVKH